MPLPKFPARWDTSYNSKSARSFQPNNGHLLLKQYVIYKIFFKTIDFVLVISSKVDITPSVPTPENL